MILTALVQTKGGTLVVDLPRDRIDLEMKIRSVGIERLSDQIHIIDDEEKSDIRVKLFGESDIGRHLSLLFSLCSLTARNGYEVIFQLQQH